MYVNNVNVVNVNKFYSFKDSCNKTRIPHNSTVELIKWSRNRNVLIKFRGETIKSMGYHLRKLTFKVAKEEIISKLSYRNRNIFPTDLKKFLEEKGFTKVCLSCGKKLTGRKTSWCSNNCSYEFSTTYMWSYIRDKMIIEAKSKCKACLKNEIPLEVHHIHPVGLGGNPFEERNLIVLCYDCHLDAHSELGTTLKDYRTKEYYINYAKERRIKTLDKFMEF